jgi:hypothetical protein
VPICVQKLSQVTDDVRKKLFQEGAGPATLDASRVHSALEVDTRLGVNSATCPLFSEFGTQVSRSHAPALRRAFGVILRGAGPGAGWDAGSNSRCLVRRFFADPSSELTGVCRRRDARIHTVGLGLTWEWRRWRVVTAATHEFSLLFLPRLAARRRSTRPHSNLRCRGVERRPSPRLVSVMMSSSPTPRA